MASMDSLHHDMLRIGFFPEKKYSQNFLLNDDVIHDMVSAASLTKKDRVLEIGGGTGFITEKLAETGAHITSIEFHRGLAPFLSKKMEPFSNVKIIEGDILHPPAELDYNKVVSAPPYAISDDIMYALFRHGVDRGILLWQMEFAEKLLSPEGSGEYHPLSILTDYGYHAEIIRKVSPKSFYPVPNHFSGVLSLKKKRNAKPVPHFPVFVSLLKTLFRFRNKTMDNALRQLKKHPVDGLSFSAFEKMVTNFELNGEKIFLISPDEYVELFVETMELQMEK